MNRLRWAGAAVLVVLLVAVVVLGLQVRADEQRAQATREALAAATGAATEILSYDHRRIDKDVAEAEQLATGRFLEQYRATTRDLAEQARAGSAIVVARVQAASVERPGRDEVTVLLFVDQTTKRSGTAAPRVDQNRVRLVLRRVDAGWRVAELETV